MVEVLRVPLQARHGVAEVLRQASSDPRPFALSGRWAGGGALVGSAPLVVLDEPADPFAVLDRQPALSPLAVSQLGEGAVGGGWVGYLGYGLGALVEQLPKSLPRRHQVPLSVLCFYDHLLHYDNQSGQWWFEALWSPEHAQRLERALALWRARLASPAGAPGHYRCTSFVPAPRPSAHRLAVARAIEHIRSGDAYQVNVCMELQADFDGNPVELWCRGVERLSPAYGACLSHPGICVASFSPELFLRRQGRVVMTSPIKGTAPSGAAGSGASSASQPALLAGSAKDRAENVMIVDLMRNDLGRTCRSGTVAVPELCRTERHPGVWHLVSDVTGELSPGVEDSELLRTTFPPGSVTGAPKVRAMELISALEATGRGVYTGCIGIASPVSGLELNVAIRTFELSGDKVWLGIGGGIVADSDPEAELEECQAKAVPLLSAVGASTRPAAARPATARRPAGTSVTTSDVTPDPSRGVFETILVRSGRPICMEAHLARLATSVAGLYGLRVTAALGGEVLELASRCAGPHRLRVLAAPAGATASLDVSLSLEPAVDAFAGLPGKPTCLVAVEVEGGLGEHKWQDRRTLDEARRCVQSAALGPHDQLLLLDCDGNVLETERANLFAIVDGVICTPAADGRILAGVTRDCLRRAAVGMGMRVSCARLSLAELEAADEVLLTSSVAGVLPVAGLDALQRWPAPGAVTARLATALWEVLGR